MLDTPTHTKTAIDFLPTLAESALTDRRQLDEEILRPINVYDLVRDYPTMRPEVIKGVLRRGETCNIIAATKTGKSFMACGLAWCIATGRPWLSLGVERGRVCIVDNELHRETLAGRLDAIADALKVPPQERQNAIDVIPLRGIGINIDRLGSRLEIEPRAYSLVILDAIYRFLPSGTSENDNAQIMAIYNRLDEYAKKWDCAIAVVHHASKGQQGDKAITDVGAGAGTISRAADTHIVIRPHAQDEMSVMEIACRSFDRPVPISIKYEYPLWHSVACTPVVMKPARQKNKERDRAEAEAMTLILEKIPTEERIQQNQLFDSLVFGQEKCRRLMKTLTIGGKVRTIRECVNGKRLKVYYQKVAPDSNHKKTDGI